MTALAIGEFAFNNLGAIAALVWTSAKLSAISFASDLAFFFTTQIPAWPAFFRENWREIFVDAFNLTKTIFGNLAENVINAVSAIWEFIASGGTSSFELAWKPLTDGFSSALRELPNIPKRELSATEQQLAAQVDAMKKRLGTGLNETIGKRLETLDALKAPKTNIPDVVSKNVVEVKKPATPPKPAGKPKEKSDKKSSEPKFAGVLQRGSAEAFSAISRAMVRSQTKSKDDKLIAESQKQTAAAESANANLAAINSKLTVAEQIAFVKDLDS